MELNSIRFNRSLLKNPSLWLGFFILGLYALSMLQIYRAEEPIKNFIPPPQGIEYFTFGLQEQLADTFWLRAVQDFDYCEEKMDAINCRGTGWLWQMLDTITNLSPHFRVVYSSGTLALSVIISDIEGASRLFDKAVRYFPKDWVILYRAAYHALYEENNKAKAARLLIESSKYGSPPWTVTLASKLYLEEGELELAERLLLQLQEQNAPEVLIKRIQQRIADFKKKSTN